MFRPFILWCVTWFALVFAISEMPSPGIWGEILIGLLQLLFAAATLAAIAAFVMSLRQRRWLRAAVQLLQGLTALVLFAGGCSYLIASFYFPPNSSDKTHEGDAQWTSTTASALPFSVEFRPAHPFLAEYDRRVVFPSGKRVGLSMDTGGAGPFAAYRLQSGEYYLVDGLKGDRFRDDFRVNTSNETVEVMSRGRWVKIPDGALSVSGTDGRAVFIKMPDGETTSDEGVQVGDTLKGRTYLGLISTDGTFKPGRGDPYAAAIEPKWSESRLPDSIPFTLASRDYRGWHCEFVVFESGRRDFLRSSLSSDSDEACAVYSLGQGRFCLVNSPEDERMRKYYRVDVGLETVEIMMLDYWVRLPAAAVRVREYASHFGSGRVDFTIETEDGNEEKVSIAEIAPVGDSLDHRVFLAVRNGPVIRPFLHGLRIVDTSRASTWSTDKEQDPLP